MSLSVGTIIKTIASIGSAIKHKSQSHALAEVRRENRDCLHLLIKEDMGSSFSDLSSARDVNLKRGAIFWTRGYMFYHPDPHFTPAGKIEALSRTVWKEGGLNPELSNYPVVEDGSYKGYYWRRISGDKGGGNTNEGVCSLCGAETANIEGQ
jgi:hypothetical protein